MNQLITGDSAEVLRTFPDKTFPITITSPPYQKLRTYNGYHFNFEEIARQLYRVTEDGGVVCWVVGDSVENDSETLEPFRQAIFFKSIGFNVHDTMIYQKKNFSHPERVRYHQIFEYVFIFSKGKPKTFNPIKDRRNIYAGKVGNMGANTFTQMDGSKGLRKRSVNTEFGMRHNVWLGKTRGQEDMCEKLQHPAMMPKWLAYDLIRSWCAPDSCVLDPMCGAATVCGEAMKLGCSYVGIDVSPEYMEIGKKYLDGLKSVDEQPKLV